MREEQNKTKQNKEIGAEILKIGTPKIITVIVKKMENRALEGVFGDNMGYFLLILHKTLCCDPSSEPSCQDGSDEGSQQMVLMRIKKNYHQILPLI